MSMRIRWLTPQDLQDAITIETMTGLDIWDRDNFLKCIKTPEVICLAAEDNFEELAGYLIYRLYSDKAMLLRLAVHPFHQRRGLGTKLLNKAASKRQHTHAIVREHSVEAQLFFVKNGFHLIKVMPALYGDEDGYRFKRTNSIPTTQDA